MKVFISCPFTGLCEEENYVIKKEFQPFFNKLIDLIKKYNMDYYLAIKRENWGLDHKGPQECTKSDYNGVVDSDFLIVIPGNTMSNGISGGVHIELGWASALNKKMFLLLEKDYKYSPVVMGLDSLTNTKYYECTSFLDDKMLDQIEDILKMEVNSECI